MTELLSEAVLIIFVNGNVKLNNQSLISPVQFVGLQSKLEMLVEDEDLRDGNIKVNICGLSAECYCCVIFS